MLFLMNNYSFPKPSMVQTGIKVAETLRANGYVSQVYMGGVQDPGKMVIYTKADTEQVKACFPDAFAIAPSVPANYDGVTLCMDGEQIYVETLGSEKTLYNIKIPTAVQSLLETLEANGYEAYIVGGCVRDALLRQPPSDWDICTSASPEQVKTCFPSRKILDTGIKHNTVTVIMDDGSYEISTFRKGEGVSAPNSAIKEDLAHRDFTINAMAYSERTGLVYCCDEPHDLKRGLLRCVGVPEDRFNEDALRILRAMRFAAQYGMIIESKTMESMHLCRQKLHDIAAERIRDEMTKILCGEYALPVLLEFSDVVATVIPEMWACIGFNQNSRWHAYTVYEHIVRSVTNSVVDPIVRWALLLHDIGKSLCYTADENGGHFYGHPDISHRLASDILTRLKFSRKDTDAVLALVLNHDREITPTPRVARRLLNEFGPSGTAQLLAVKRADALAHAGCAHHKLLSCVADMRKLLDRVTKEKQCFSRKDLAITGNDILGLGIPQGPAVGYVIDHLLSWVIGSKIPNQRDVLLAEAKIFWKYREHPELSHIGKP